MSPRSSRSVWEPGRWRWAGRSSAWRMTKPRSSTTLLVWRSWRSEASLLSTATNSERLTTVPSATPRSGSASRC
ncbi:MAG: hypothetical protein ACE5JP_02165 [Candidatus Bipolaricaulia bacterium]